MNLTQSRNRRDPSSPNTRVKLGCEYSQWHPLGLPSQAAPQPYLPVRVRAMMRASRHHEEDAFVPNEADNHLTMVNLLYGGMVAQLISAITKVGIPQELSTGAKSAAQLAQQLGLNCDAAQRVLRGLTLFDVVEETAESTFILTPLGQQLLPQTKNSLHYMAVLMGQPWHANAFPALSECLRTGQSAFELVHGASLFPWLQSHPSETQLFADAMKGFSLPEIEQVLTSYDFSGFKRLADVGGGTGTFLAGILCAHPHLHGVLFDQAPVLDSAEELLTQEGVFARCELAAGDFFAAVPSGCDAYLLKHVLHDWQDEDAERILRRITAAMGEGSKLLVVEQVIPDGHEPHPSKLLDAFMLALTGGRERTRAEHEHLLQRAGLRLTRVAPTPGPLSVVEAQLA